MSFVCMKNMAAQCLKKKKDFELNQYFGKELDEENKHDWTQASGHLRGPAVFQLGLGTPSLLLVQEAWQALAGMSRTLSSLPSLNSRMTISLMLSHMLLRVKRELLATWKKYP